MAHQLTEKQMAKCKDAFSVFDKDGDGTISTNELEVVMRSIGQNPTEEDVQEIISEVDANGNGKIDFSEFMTVMTKLLTDKRMNDDEILQAFHEIDKDASGFISADELRDIMRKHGDNLSDNELNDMIQQADTDGDGKVNYEGQHTAVFTPQESEIPAYNLLIRLPGICFPLTLIPSIIEMFP